MTSLTYSRFAVPVIKLKLKLKTKKEGELKMGSKIKELRGQVRQIVKELLPEVLNQEQFKALEKTILDRLDVLEKQTKDVLSEMNQRHKDTMGYLVRNTTKT